MHKTISGLFTGLLSVGLLSAADKVAAASPTPVRITDSRAVTSNAAADADDTSVVATIRSTGGLILNGVPTPRGVNSVVVTRGDVIQTLSAPAVAFYPNGQSTSLAAASTYRSLPGRLEAGTGSSKTGASLFALPPVSVIKR